MTEPMERVDQYYAQATVRMAREARRHAAECARLAAEARRAADRARRAFWLTLAGTVAAVALNVVRHG